MTLFVEHSARSSHANGERTLVDTLLDEQRQLTAVEAFARSHERHEITAPRYRKLMPVSAPRPGEQYGFEVDLDQCSGCKACVTACHSLNGLDDGEAWREVGALFGESTTPCESGGNRIVPLQQIVTTACHHCIEPGCLEGCPVLAYDKDPLTGIVRHLDDQCIGCSYCILKCPYDVPKYSESRGIVRKCDMCHGRLATGEAPTCVQACPNEAIRISIVDQASVRKASVPSSRPDDWLPDSPSAAITLPTTRYVTKKPITDLRAADHSLPKPQNPHWPLIVMLVLTQAGIGGLLASKFSQPQSLPLELISLAFLFAGLAASVFHLGQPLKAWRVWLGWRTSWLSREAMLLNSCAGAAVICVAAHRLPLLAKYNSLTTFAFAILSMVAVFAQAMVYADTHRAFWSLRYTAPRFFGSALVLGLGLVLAFQPSTSLAIALLLVTLLKLGCELAVLKHADCDSDRWTQLRRTAALQTGVLRPVLAVRLLAALVGGVVLPFAIATGAASTTLAVSAFVLCLLGELAERYLFFTSVAPDKMPV